MAWPEAKVLFDLRFTERGWRKRSPGPGPVTFWSSHVVYPMPYALLSCLVMLGVGFVQRYSIEKYTYTMLNLGMC